MSLPLCHPGEAQLIVWRTLWYTVQFFVETQTLPQFRSTFQTSIRHNESSKLFHLDGFSEHSKRTPFFYNSTGHHCCAAVTCFGFPGWELRMTLLWILYRPEFSMGVFYVGCSPWEPAMVVFWELASPDEVYTTWKILLYIRLYADSLLYASIPQVKILLMFWKKNINKLDFKMVKDTNTMRL